MKWMVGRCQWMPNVDNMKATSHNDAFNDEILENRSKMHCGVWECKWMWQDKNNDMKENVNNKTARLMNPNVNDNKCIVEWKMKSMRMG